MSKPLVSIILPVYNAQNHIARCLESICAQSWQNIEVIVLNDGSKDQSLPVCEAFRAKDERIVLVDKANSGVSDTRNLGLKLASGKYVQFVDSDDYIDPDFTEHLVTAAEQNNADLVIAPYKMVIPAGATKPEQVLDKLQDELGVMTVARPAGGTGVRLSACRGLHPGRVCPASDGQACLLFLRGAVEQAVPPGPAGGPPDPVYQ